MNLAGEGGVAGERESAPSGVYSCDLVTIEKVMRRDFNDSNKEIPNFVWKWETNEVGDAEGRPFAFTKYTKTWFGDDRANLTKLMDQMFGKRLTREEYEKLDSAWLMKQKWDVKVSKEYNQAGREVNIVQSVTRKVAEQPAKPPRPKSLPTEDIADPFAD
jgi:hypothetical protein